MINRERPSWIDGGKKVSSDSRMMGSRRSVGKVVISMETGGDGREMIQQISKTGVAHPNIQTGINLGGK